jgi:HEAT repeat protein
MNTIATLPLTVQVHPDRKMEGLLAELSPTTSWENRQIAAKKLGYMRDPEALPALLQALLTDAFWMVRNAIIQALEVIGDSAAIPTLEVAAVC